jgi:hypothetical protein
MQIESNRKFRLVSVLLLLLALASAASAQSRPRVVTLSVGAVGCPATVQSEAFS